MCVRGVAAATGRLNPDNPALSKKRTGADVGDAHDDARAVVVARARAVEAAAVVVADPALVALDLIARAWLWVCLGWWVFLSARRRGSCLVGWW